MPDRLLSVDAAGDVLGLNPADVLRLIHSGRLPAKRLIARGTGKRPRLRVLESAVAAFIDAMPDAVIEPTSPTPKRRQRAIPPDLKSATTYY